MVEYNSLLNAVYHTLSDPTRRDILLRVSKEELSIKAIAQPYSISFAAVAKHISVLEHAQLIHKRRLGKQQMVRVTPETISLIKENLGTFEKVWNQRFKALDTLLQSTK